MTEQAESPLVVVRDHKGYYSFWLHPKPGEIKRFFECSGGPCTVFPVNITAQANGLKKLAAICGSLKKEDMELLVLISRLINIDRPTLSFSEPEEEGADETPDGA